MFKNVPLCFKISLYALASGISFPALVLALVRQTRAEVGVKSSLSGSEESREEAEAQPRLVEIPCGYVSGRRQHRGAFSQFCFMCLNF